jgi:hypothetical protein
MRPVSGCFLLLVGFLLGGFIGGVYGFHRDGVAIQRMLARGDEVVDYPPLETFFFGLSGAVVGALAVPFIFISSRVLTRSKPRKPTRDGLA